MSDWLARPFNYMLDADGNVVACQNLIEWAIWMETADRKVELTVIGKVNVSTVFLGMDHNHFGQGAPILFETMIWVEVPDDGVNHGRYWLDGQMRYATVEDARAGHAALVAAVEERVIFVPEYLLTGESDESHPPS